MDAELTALDPRFRSVLRIEAAIRALIIVAGAVTAETLTPIWPGSLLIPALLIGVWLVFIAPARRFTRWGYQFGTDQLRIARGYLFRSDTVVPLGRIQHIDVREGPIMRRYGLAELRVHTAGNHNASVSLPGLAREDALAMRESIRLHIKQAQA